MGVLRRRTEFIAAIWAAAFIAGESLAAECDLALVLALDASSSVDADEFDLQTNGVARALRDPEVKSAILLGGGIWLSAFEWSGRQQQVLYADWQLLDSEPAIDRFSDRLAAVRRGYSNYPTSIGYALGYASNQLARLPASCRRKVVDISGDGANNDGFSPASAYKEFDFTNVTVNGLVIAGRWPDPVAYYRDKIIHGPGAFLEIANNYKSYADAMKRKLLREIDGKLVSGLDLPPAEELQ